MVTATQMTIALPTPLDTDDDRMWLARASWDAERAFPLASRDWEDLCERERERAWRYYWGHLADDPTAASQERARIERGGKVPFPPPLPAYPDPFDWERCRAYWMVMASRAREWRDRRRCVGTARYCTHQLVRSRKRSFA